jgi:hypothetical protein
MRTMRLIVVALLALLCVPAAALAHGDASTHYLETGDFYPGFGARASQETELGLIGLLDAAKAAGYPVKVSILGDATDVSDTPDMLQHPQRYATFVATELERSHVKLVGPVVIVSPYGVGVAGPGAERLDLPTGKDGEQLVAAAATAVRTLADTAGHPLPANVAPASVPVITPPEPAGDGYDLSGLTPLIVFVAIFGSALLYVRLRERTTRLSPPLISKENNA